MFELRSNSLANWLSVSSYLDFSGRDSLPRTYARAHRLSIVGASINFLS